MFPAKCMRTASSNAYPFFVLKLYSVFHSRKLRFHTWHFAFPGEDNFPWGGVQRRIGWHPHKWSRAAVVVRCARNWHPCTLAKSRRRSGSEKRRRRCCSGRHCLFGQLWVVGARKEITQSLEGPLSAVSMPNFAISRVVAWFQESGLCKISLKIEN